MCLWSTARNYEELIAVGVLGLLTANAPADLRNLS